MFSVLETSFLHITSVGLETTFVSVLKGRVFKDYVNAGRPLIVTLFGNGDGIPA